MASANLSKTSVLRLTEFGNYDQTFNPSGVTARDKATREINHAALSSTAPDVGQIGDIKIVEGNRILLVGTLSNANGALTSFNGAGVALVRLDAFGAIDTQFGSADSLLLIHRNWPLPSTPVCISR